MSLLLLISCSLGWDEICLAFWFLLLLKAARGNLGFSEFWAGFSACFQLCFWAWGIFLESREVFLGGLKACGL